MAINFTRMSNRTYVLVLVGAVLCGLALTVGLVSAQARWDEAKAAQGPSPAAVQQALSELRTELATQTQAARTADAERLTLAEELRVTRGQLTWVLNACVQANR